MSVFPQVVVGCLLAVWMAGPVQTMVHSDVSDVVKESFEVRPGGTLSVDMDHGNLEIEVHRGNMVHIEVERIVSVNDRSEANEILTGHELELSSRGDDVYIESRFEDIRSFWRGGNHVKIVVRVRVPVAYNIEFATGMGNVWIVDVEGHVEGKTGAGNIETEAIRGDLNLRSGSGNISLAHITGYIEATTGAGNIDARDVCGGVDFNTGAGNIDADLSCQPEGDSRFTSGAGNVTVYLAEAIQGDVDAVAGMGSARTDFPFKVEGRWMKKSFHGELNGGGPDIHLRAGVGNVALLRR